MAKKKSNQQVGIKLAEIRGEAMQGQPRMFVEVLTASGVATAFKGAELAMQGVGKVIDARAKPLEFYIRDSWLADGRHWIHLYMHNATKNGVYIESFDIKREYLDPSEIDPNRITQPTVAPERSLPFQGELPAFEYPLLIPAEGNEELQLSLPKVDRKKMKSECAVAKVHFADLGKGKSDTMSFEFRLRWHPR